MATNVGLMATMSATIRGNESTEWDSDSEADETSSDSEASPIDAYLSLQDTPLLDGDRVREVQVIEELRFLPSQEPRTSHALPGSCCSPYPIGPVKLRLLMLRTKQPDGFYDVFIILCIRKGVTIGNLKATFARRPIMSPNPRFSLSLYCSSIFDDEGKLRPELIKDFETLRSRVWGLELEVGDGMYINMIHVQDRWEGLGIGKKMIDLTLEWAKRSDVRHVFVFPLSHGHRERRARDGQIDLGIGYFRQHGFRRVGSLPYFCYSMDPANPSHLIAPGDDYDPPEGTEGTW